MPQSLTGHHSSMPFNLFNPMTNIASSCLSTINSLSWPQNPTPTPDPNCVHHANANLKTIGTLSTCDPHWPLLSLWNAEATIDPALLHSTPYTKVCSWPFGLASCHLETHIIPRNPIRTPARCPMNSQQVANLPSMGLEHISTMGHCHRQPAPQLTALKAPMTKLTQLIWQYFWTHGNYETSTYIKIPDK